MGQCTSSQDSDKEKRPKLKSSARKYKQGSNNEPHMNSSSKSNGVPETTKINNSSYPSSHGDASISSNGVCEKSHPVPESSHEVAVNEQNAIPTTESKNVVPVVLVTSASEGTTGYSVQDCTPDSASVTNDTAVEITREVPEPVDTPKEPLDPNDTPKEPPEPVATDEEAIENCNNDSCHDVPKKPSLSVETPEPSTEDILHQVENILKPLELTKEDYIKVMDMMLDDMVKGMTPESHEKSNIKCFPTYVRSVPDGSETGDFLALDLGGTNFRVLLINLNKEEVKMESKIYIIPQHIMLGSGSQLFDHIADCIFKFMTDQQLFGRELPLGFTFSFPCRQVGLDKAILTTWTKGFKCEGVEGNDIVKLLHEAIERRGDMNNVRCLAVINDTVGALMSCAHSDRQCAIGLILGTGTNACYIDKLSEVKTWDGDQNDPKQVLINTEWGAFGNDGNLDFILTDFDKSIDKHSINPGKQIYEKMISGMYMGEIARLAIVRLLKHNLLFDGEGSFHLSTRGRFYTKYVSEIEGDDVDSFTVTKQIFEELEITSYTEQDCRLVRHVCSLVSRRAAFLASAGIACLLNKMDRKQVTVGVDGSLYRFHPFFHDLMMEKIRELTHPDIQFKLMLSHDGSGKGAALVAAVAHRLLKEKDDKGDDNGNAASSEH